MDLALTETQQLLQNTAMELMERELPRKRVRELDESPTGFAPDLWQRMCQLGWSGITIPEEYGGSDQSFTDAGVLFEVLGRYNASGPLLDSTVLAAQTLLELGSDSQKRSLLPAIASGQQIVGFAFTEPEYAWGASGIHLRATRQAGNYVLNGAKLFIPWAHIADQLLVVARTGRGTTPEGGISLFMVDAKARGISTRLLSGWLGEKLCEVTFNNVAVPASAIVGPAGRAWAGLERAMDRATILLCAYMAGGAVKVYEMARDYSQTRIAFGVPIGTFQWVQTHVLDALTEAEATKWTAYEALWRLDNKHADTAIGISGAKAVASVGYSKACDGSHDVHAGIGIDLDFGLTHHTVRARTFQQYLGDAVYHKKRMAKLMALAGG